MGFMSMLALLVSHPFEFRTLVQFYLYHEQKRDIASITEHPTSGWDRKSMRRCWEFLDQTSRSFSAVIKELDGDLARVICLFYLVLRGLDTIEDDMTISDEIKQPILRSFHKHTITPGWNFEKCGPNEKDRQLLVEYDVVVEEVNRLPEEYRAVILDICEKMETGMADYAHKAATTGSIYLERVSEYDLYCHYVAGLVGEGLSGLFSASGKEAKWLSSQLELSNSMGLLLQKTNIIRDFREDVEQQRYFWPRELWGSKERGGGFTEMKEMCNMADPEVKERAMWAQSAMIVDALRHATDSLDYLKLLKNQSVFVFCAIPASMALATLALCFRNPAMFERNIKIRKAEAASLIMRSTNPREVSYMFREYARQIHAKAVSTDPNFLRLSVACGKIEQWCEHHYPSFVLLLPPTGPNTKTTQLMNEDDARSRIVHMEQKVDDKIALRRRREETRNGAANGNGLTPADRKDGETSREAMMYFAASMLIVLVVGCGVIWAVLTFVD